MRDGRCERERKSRRAEQTNFQRRNIILGSPWQPLTGVMPVAVTGILTGVLNKGFTGEKTGVYTGKITGKD